MSEDGTGASQVAVEFGDGAAGRACALRDNVLHAVGPTAYAPGRPLQLHIRLPEVTFGVRGKSLGAKRRADGAFDLRIRLVDLRREDRERLQRALT